MNLILTHEHADFDAIASLMAAWLLNPGYLAVRPIHVNRNVAVYLKDYRAEIPFHVIKNLPREKAENVLLVDTHRLFSDEFIGAKTQIRVIDHHLPGPKVSPEWSCRFETIGACTSILIPELRRQGVRLVPEVANLLLLGIYEDTGNLTYGSTTVQDLRAATCLIEQGADINILQRYLHQPLTDSQQVLADRCLETMETITIAGEEIVIATADAIDIHDEYSTVAHYLRDMTSPDALFILLRSRAGLRLIGRATNDRINVGKVMKNFHGGGHPRAAAGLLPIENEEDPTAEMKTVRDHLVELLPSYITPRITVNAISSANPLTLQDTLSIKATMEIVRRYSHEGYPVVDAAGKPVGLLNRRQLDHAHEFELDDQLSSIMEIGSFSVLPDDSIDTVQNIMNLSGWGQLPVVDERSGTVIGIVTRTDLLRALGQGERDLRQNFAAELDAAFSPGAKALIDAVASVAQQFRFPVYIVGGFVRDLLLKLPVHDFDIVIEGDAVKVAHWLVRRYGGKLRAHPQFGTAKWELQGAFDLSGLPDFLDLISARTEFYDYPTALPTVERSSIKLDLHRRDFTINTLALRLDGDAYGDLLDFWGGMNDLTRRQIRTLHSLSFTDDPTRMIRAVRFEQRFNFQIEANTLERLMLSARNLKQVSGQRIRHEFQLLFAESDPPACFARLENLGLLRAIHPDLRWTAQNSADFRRFHDAEPNETYRNADPGIIEFLRSWGAFVCWLGTERADTIQQLANRFQIPVRVLASISGLAKLFCEFAGVRKKRRSEAVFFLERIPLPAIYCYDVLSDSVEINAFLDRYLNDFRNRKPITTGETLKKAGFPPGAWMSQLIDRLRAARIDDEITSANEEAVYLERALAELRAHNEQDAQSDSVGEEKR